MTTAQKTDAQVAEETGIPVEAVAQVRKQLERAKMAALLLVVSASQDPARTQAQVREMVGGAHPQEGELLIAGFIALANDLMAEVTELKKQAAG